MLLGPSPESKSLDICTQNLKAALCYRDYADFRVSSDGEVQGVGLLIAQDPDSRKLLVLAPIRGSPADRAGIQPGACLQALRSSASVLACAFPSQGTYSKCVLVLS